MQLKLKKGVLEVSFVILVLYLHIASRHGREDKRSKNWVATIFPI